MKRLISFALILIALLPIPRANALSLAYIVFNQQLTIELATDGSAQIEDQITYGGPSSFTVFYQTPQALDLEIAVLDETTNTTTPLSKYDSTSDRDLNLYEYQVTEEEGGTKIELVLGEFEESVTLVYNYRQENFVTNHDDVAVLQPLKGAQGLIQQYTDATIRLVLPAGLDLETEQEKIESENVPTSSTSSSNLDSDTLDDDKPAVQPAVEPKPEVTEPAHFTERLPGGIYVWLFYAEGNQVTVESDETNTIIEISLPDIGLSEPIEVQVAVSVERFPDNAQVVEGNILAEIVAVNSQRMLDEEPYEDIW